MLRLQLFAGLALQIDGRSVEPPSKRRARSLLGWLALERQMHPRSELAGRFWPDVLDESARTSLRGALSVLRHALGPDADRYLISTRDGVGLAGEPDVRTDLDEFERLVARDELGAALELCAGELLAGLDDDWVYERREQHRARLSELIGTLAQRAADGDDLAQAITLTRRQIAIDPLAEEPQRDLMRRLTAAGDRAGAIFAYERFSARLREELRILPSPVTRELAAALRTSDKLDIASPAATARRRIHAPSSPAPIGDRRPPLATSLSEPELTALIGRDAQLARLDLEWKRSVSGGPRVVLLEGEPGIGKTRLATELCRTVHADGALVLFGRCHEEALLPYQPFTEALGQYVSARGLDQLHPQLGDDRQVLAKLLPALSHEGEEDDRLEAEGDPSRERYRLLEAVSSLLREATRVSPLLLVLDDLHWAGRATLQMLRHLTRSRDRAPMMILATCRRTEPDPEQALEDTLAELRRERRLEWITLDPLSERDVRSFLAARALDASPEAARILHRRTEGNPLFIEEMIHDLTQGLGHDDWITALEHAGAPDSVRDLTRRRLRRLDDSCRQTLAAAAIIGPEVDLQLLQAVTGHDQEQLIEQLEQLLEAHVLGERRDAPSCFTFTHALIRDAVRDRLSGIRIAQLHRKVAQALEAIHVDDLDQHAPQLAYHFTAAAELGKALEYRRRAAEAALAVFAFESALQHYDAAVEAATQLGRDPVSDPITRDLHLQRLRLRRIAEFSQDLEGRFHTVLEAARASGDHDCEIEALNELGLVHRQWDMPGAAQYHESALAIAEKVGNVPAQVQALARLSLIHSNMLELDRALELGEQALARARSVGDDYVLARAMDCLKLVALQIGDLDRVGQLTRELERIHGARNDLWYLQWTLLESGYVPLAAARWEAAEQRFAEAAALNRRLHDQATEPLMHEAFCWLHRSRGDYTGALSAGYRARQIGLYTGTWQGWIAATLAWTLLELRGVAQAVGVLEAALPRIRQVASRNDLLRSLSQLAWAYSLAGQHTDASEMASQAHKLLDQISAPPGTAYVYGAHAYVALARAYLNIDQPETGLRVLLPINDAADRSGWLEATVTTNLALGLCHEQLGQQDNAREHLIHAAATSDDAGLPGPAWEAHAALSRLERAAGHAAEAERHGSLALKTAQMIEAGLEDKQLRATFSDAVASTTSVLTAP